MNRKGRKLRDALVVPLEEQAARLAEAYVHRAGESEKNREPDAPRPKTEARKSRNPRGVYEKVPGSGEWWIRYNDSSGRFRREIAGSKSIAIKLVEKRRTEAREGRKLPETLRRPTITFGEIAKDALAYSKASKLSYSDDVYRMETLLGWFREYPAEGIMVQDIERRFEQRDWSPATTNRYRALLSLTYRLAIRNHKVKENPARSVRHRLENNARIRFLSPEEETRLRAAIEATCQERIAELNLSLHTGLRMSEQYRLRWEDVSFTLRTLTIPRSKNGATRHVPLNKAALRALESLEKRANGSGLVCGGATGPRRWFEPVVKAAGLTAFSWHCLRHTFASRLVMAGVDIRTVQELMGHKTIAMTVRYSHLAPKHTLAAVERLDASTGRPTDTTTDTAHSVAVSAEPTGLQQLIQ